METKVCTKCGRELPLDQFNWRDKAKGTRRADCKQCHSGHMRMTYLKKREEISQLKLQIKCQKCGYDKCPDALEFHHTNPEEKDYTISQALRLHKSEEEIQNEMKKCVILCSNCHKEFHWRERENNLSLEEFMK